MYEEAFEALRSSDFTKAADLLERAARETGYLVDSVNHAFTLACYRSGQTERLGRFSYRLAKRFVSEDPASAMDYFQRALLAGLAPEETRAIGEVFEGWADLHSRSSVKTPIRRVAHIVGCLLEGHAPSTYLRTLVSSLGRHGIESTVFTTEWAASWFFNAQESPQSESFPVSAEVHVASVAGDFLERAERIAEAVRSSACPVAFYHSSLSEQITARVAAFRPAAIQINVNHGSEMDADLFDGRIHLFRNGVARTRFGHRPSRWIPLASEIDERLRRADHLARRTFGEASTISATFGNLYKVSGEDYLATLSGILARSPDHVHVFAGSGDPRAARDILRRNGVLRQVRFIGHQADVAPLFAAIDVYVASFPHSGGHSIIEAMGAGKPVVVLGYPEDSHYNSGAELVGLQELIASDPHSFIEIACRLIAERDYRDVVAQAVRKRFETEFTPDRLGTRYLNFIGDVLRDLSVVDGFKPAVGPIR